MSDLILNINFLESKRKNQIIIETFTGIIPKLKSRKYSGLLRIVNVNALSTADNLLEMQFRYVMNFLNHPLNIQIDKNKYLISNANLRELFFLAGFRCLFYKSYKSGPMYQVEEIIYDDADSVDYLELSGVKIGGKIAKLYIYISNENTNLSLNEIIAIACVNLSEENYPLELVFDYKSVDNSVKNFGFEAHVKEILKKYNWIYRRDNNNFEYTGRNINADLEALIENGINIYTNTQKKVTAGDFSNIRVSYNIDWFGVEGQVKIDGHNIDISNLIDFNKKIQNWTEYNGKIILLPEAFSHVSIDKDSGALRIKKRNILDALFFAQKLNSKPIKRLEEYINYNEISLQINEDLAKILRPYQVTGVKWLLSLKLNNFGGCLADDMGLGKTLQVIAFLSDLRFKDSRNLIIVPKTLLINWKREFQKFLPDVKVYLYHGAGREKKNIPVSKVTLSTYGTILNDSEIIQEFQFDNLILDEAQYVKNSDSRTYKALFNIKAHTRIILTGTPIENNIEEFWGLMKFINFDIIKSFNGLDENQSLTKLKLATSLFVLRRVKQNVLSDLPRKQEQVLYCEMGNMQYELYHKILESIRFELLRTNSRYEIKDNSAILKGLLYLQEVCCHPLLLNKDLNTKNCSESTKMDVLENILKNAYESGHKVVVFSRFTRMLKIIKEKINFLHMNYFYLDGKTKNRIAIVEEFEQSKSGIFLISLKAGGFGINLVSADIAIIYDPWWNPAVEKQAEDRLYRIGQKNNVMIYRLITVDTIEEKIYELQHRKQDLYSQILDNSDVPANLTLEILENLINDS